MAKKKTINYSKFKTLDVFFKGNGEKKKKSNVKKVIAIENETEASKVAVEDAEKQTQEQDKDNIILLLKEKNKSLKKNNAKLSLEKRKLEGRIKAMEKKPQSKHPKMLIASNKELSSINTAVQDFQKDINDENSLDK